MTFLKTLDNVKNIKYYGV